MKKQSVWEKLHVSRYKGMQEETTSSLFQALIDFVTILLSILKQYKLELRMK